MSDLFDSLVLRVEQPRGLPSARSNYKILDGHGTLLADAAEEGVSLRRQVTRAVFGHGTGHRTVYVNSAEGRPLLVLERPRGALAGAKVSAPDGPLIGSFQVNRNQYRYRLLDAEERQVGALDSDLSARRFKVVDAAGTHVAQVDKKWRGAAAELLTTADRYSVEIFASLPDPLRILVVASPLAIDMMLHEGKDWPIGS